MLLDQRTVYTVTIILIAQNILWSAYTACEEPRQLSFLHFTLWGMSATAWNADLYGWMQPLLLKCGMHEYELEVAFLPYSQLGNEQHYSWIFVLLPSMASSLLHVASSALSKIQFSFQRWTNSNNWPRFGVVFAKIPRSIMQPSLESRIKCCTLSVRPSIPLSALTEKWTDGRTGCNTLCGFLGRAA